MNNSIPADRHLRRVKADVAWRRALRNGCFTLQQGDESVSHLSRRLPALLLPLTLSLPATVLSAQQPSRSFERQEFQRRGADVTISAHGRLRTNRVAIGGETTGTELQTEEFTFDLDLSRVDRGRRN